MEKRGSHELYLYSVGGYEPEATMGLTIQLDVKRSAPVRVIITRPIGNSKAPIKRIKPGAFSWYHGAVLTLNVMAHLP